MKTEKGRLRVLFYAAVLVFGVSCASAPSPQIDIRSQRTLHPPDVVEIAAMVTARESVSIPEGSGVVVAGIRGFEKRCGGAVRHALTSRLAENPRYQVVTRDNLGLLVQELDAGWNGRFDTGTVKALGNLLGVSYFVFSDIIYCGLSASNSPDSEFGKQFNIIAFLQVIDSGTGRIVMATSSEGVYLSRPSPSWPFRESLNDPVPIVVNEAAKARHQSDDKSWLEKKLDMLGLSDFDGGDSSPIPGGLPPGSGGPAGGLVPIPGGLPPGSGGGDGDSDERPTPEPEAYQILRAAEAMAGHFADKFFGRPTWEKLEMWRDDRWIFDQSVRLVQLGQCPKAVVLMGSTAANELSAMADADISRYLHNYGVALMCANQPERALGKLRAAYQVGYNKTTLKMIGIATRLVEWSLEVQVNKEPEVEMLLRREPSGAR